MFKNLLLNLSSTGKLVRDIRNDHYANWETHFNNYNNTHSQKADPVKLQALGLEIYEFHLKAILGDYAITDKEKELLTKIKAYFQLSDAAIDSIISRYAKTAISHLSKQKLADNEFYDKQMSEVVFKVLTNAINADAL